MGPQPILVAGTLTVDDIRTPLGENKAGLGGSATYFTLVARLFAPVQVVGAVGEEDAERFRKVLSDGHPVDLAGLVISKRPTFHWVAEHDFQLGRTSRETAFPGAYEEFHPVLPRSAQRVGIAFIGSMLPPLQLSVVEQLHGQRPLVVGDTMRVYAQTQRDLVTRFVAQLDLLVVNESEAMALTDEANAADSTKVLFKHHPRLKWIVIKEGALGATLYGREETEHLPAYLSPDKVIDPTGAGDAVAGALLGYLSERGATSPSLQTMREGLAYGMVAASFAIEAFSIERLTSLTRAALEERMQRYRERIAEQVGK
jgi:sugar/nucleoside kinase (ribokinase family)